jgi:hypothetical protein
MKAAEIRAKIQRVRDIKQESVPTPEWADEGIESVNVRGLSGYQRDEFEDSCLKRGKAGQAAEFNANNLRAKMVIRCVVDDDGDLVFHEDDLIWLGNKSASALSRIYDVAARLSRIGAEDLDELLKNSARVQGDGSSSVSHLPSDARSQTS